MGYPARIDPSTLGAQALAVVEELGWDSWSLRDVARALGVSANALYRYVDNREDLVVAVGEAATNALTSHLVSAQGEGQERIIDMAHRWVEFSQARPAAYAAIVQAKPGPEHPRVVAWHKMMLEVRRHFDAVVPQAADAAAFAFWALVRGRAGIVANKATLVGPTVGLRDAVRALLVGYVELGEVDSPIPEKVRAGYPVPGQGEEQRAKPKR